MESPVMAITFPYDNPSFVFKSCSDHSPKTCELKPLPIVLERKNNEAINKNKARNKIFLYFRIILLIILLF